MTPEGKGLGHLLFLRRCQTPTHLQDISSKMILWHLCLPIWADLKSHTSSRMHNPLHVSLPPAHLTTADLKSVDSPWRNLLYQSWLACFIFCVRTHKVKDWKQRHYLLEQFVKVAPNLEVKRCGEWLQISQLCPVRHLADKRLTERHKKDDAKWGFSKIKITKGKN